MTNVGERPFQPDLGTSIPRLLFDNVDFGTAAQIADEITRVIEKYEQRVILTEVDVTPVPDDNTFEVTIHFEIIGIPYTQEIEFYLESTR